MNESEHTPISKNKMDNPTDQANRKFLEEKGVGRKQMASELPKRYSLSPIIEELQIKTMRYCFKL